MTDFRKEIDLNLTKDQQTRLKEMEDRRHQMIMQNRNSHNDTLNPRMERWHYPERRPPDGQLQHNHERDTNRLPDHE